MVWVSVLERHTNYQTKMDLITFDYKDRCNSELLVLISDLWTARETNSWCWEAVQSLMDQWKNGWKYKEKVKREIFMIVFQVIDFQFVIGVLWGSLGVTEIFHCLLLDVKVVARARSLRKFCGGSTGAMTSSGNLNQ